METITLSLANMCRPLAIDDADSIIRSFHLELNNGEGQKGQSEQNGQDAQNGQVEA
jgi:hypothetical protein